jgi:hypothetical protein
MSQPLTIAVAFAALLLAACSSGGADDPYLDSGSHWLVACESDSECGSLLCECGFCTRPCDSTSQCGDALCFNPATASSCESPEAAICGMLCDDSSECDETSACINGTCIASAATPQDIGLGDAASDVDSDPTEDPVVTDVEPDEPDVVDDDADDVGDVDADWEPSLCEESECGIEDGAVAPWRCPDGSSAGEVCVRTSPDMCEWFIRECPQEILSCYGSGDCPEEMACNAGDLCVSDPECPACDVCFGWCVDPATACSNEECGTSPGINVRCSDASLGGPLCERDEVGVCAWRERTCPE